MNPWYKLTNGLETEVPPLDEAARGRVRRLAESAVRRRRRRRWLPLALAAALALSACGYAAATGQFSQWFRNLAADPRQPEASEDLLAGLGTVIGQSQTADGVTVTLNGALWDGNRLVLSLSLEGEDLVEGYSNQVQSPDSWLDPPRDAAEAELRETHPNMAEDDLQAYLDSYYSPDMRTFRSISIDYLYDRKTGDRWLQVSRPTSSASEAARQELTLHLENLSYCNTVLNGPFDFTFTVERKRLDRAYTGGTVIQPEDGPALRITGVTVSPFRVDAAYETVDPVPDEQPEGMQVGRLRMDGQEVDTAGQWGREYGQREDGRLEGKLWAGPFHRPVDPAAVEAVELCGVWVELGEWELTEPAEP